MNRCKPEVGERYWRLSEAIEVNEVFWGNYYSDNASFDTGNCFKTEAEAEAAAKKVKALLLSLHGEVANLQPEVAKLPKLTAEVFSRPDCPEWAKYAAVNSKGTLIFFGNKPNFEGEDYGCWSCSAYMYKHIKGFVFDASDWQNSLIERPAKLTDWCKVGKWFWHPEDMAGGRYLKITEIRGGGVYAKEKEDYDPDYLCFDLVRKYSKQARLRPYNAEEIPDLPFEVTERNSNFRTTVVSCQGNNVWLGGASTAISTEELMREFTAKGSPCGVLEHLEDGDWVK